MRAAVICGDRWHPAEVIEQGLSPLNDGSITLEFFTDTDGWTPERIGQYDVLVLARDNAWMTDTAEQAIRAYVGSGGNLLVLHSGTVGCKNFPPLYALVGGAFVHHPHPGPVTLEYVGDFGRADGDPRTVTVHDEHYFVETVGDLDVFLRSTSEHGTQPAGWTRAEGKGRVCVLTPGHYAEVWASPVYQHTLRKALDWCAAAKEEAA